MLLANLCKTYLEGYGQQAEVVQLYSDGGMDDVINAVQSADTVVISGPCYVNTYPAMVTKLLTEWERRALRGQKVYGIIQGGMPYTHTHKSGLNLLEVFADKTGLRYHGGFVCGMGAMVDGVSLDRLPNAKKMKRQLNVFFANIRDGKVSGDAVYESAAMKMPTLLAKLLARMLSRSVDKSYAELGLDAKRDSPYRSDALR